MLGLDAFLHMLIFYNFIHADLHPGNIMVKFYKPSAYHKFQQIWSKLIRRELKDDGEVALERISAVSHDYELMRKELEKLQDEGYSPCLIFLDTGLVTELNEVNRRNFLDLFRAIAEFDGYRTGQLMVERCRTPELVIDPEVFALKMQHIILDIKQRTFQLGQVKVANLLHTVMNMVREHHVKLEGDFVNVVVSILLLEGIGRQLDPNLDLLKSAIPVLRDYSVKDGAKGALDRMKSVEDIKGATPWLKVWFWLEAREWLASNTRENEWLTLWQV
jgi:aarF domain-containing kinase